MVRAAVAGIAGRMGSRIAQLVRESDGIELVGVFEHPAHPAVGKDVAEVIGGSPGGIKICGNISEVLEEADVVIDFTSASASLGHLQAAAAKKVPMVMGSTGFSAEQMAQARELSQEHALCPDPQHEHGGQRALQGRG